MPGIYRSAHMHTEFAPVASVVEVAKSYTIHMYEYFTSEFLSFNYEPLWVFAVFRCLRESDALVSCFCCSL